MSQAGVLIVFEYVYKLWNQAFQLTGIFC